jgi:protein-L-isoaspartate(D-aspartate) O-methyltransferase
MSGFAIARQKMVDGQVRTSDVTDRRIIDAMLAVPREIFVPESRRALAYLDLDLDVCEADAAVKRYLVKPQLSAKLLQAADIAAGDCVLVVGCATGYLAALVAHLAGKVTAIESDSTLVERGQAALAQAGIQNVTLKSAELLPQGDPANAPYDAIILNGATEIATVSLCEQLRDGGRLVGVFAAARPPRAMVVTRSHGDCGSRVLFDAVAPTLPGFQRVPAFVF